MASVSKKDIPKEAEFMTEMWHLIKDFWVPESDVAYWIALFKQIDILAKKYPMLFAKKMMLAYAEFLDEKLRKGGESN